MAYYSIILCSSYILFLLFGGFIFMYLEWETTETVKIIELPSWTLLREIALSPHPPSSEDELTSLVGWVLGNCSALPHNTSQILTSTGNHSEFVTLMEATCPWLRKKFVQVHHHYPWSFIDSLYFSMTVSTTIGYGHISPSTSIGRVVCILYSLVGIPLTGILLAWTSGMFGERLFKLFKSKASTEKQSSRIFIAFISTFYIFAGFVVFIFLPALIFINIEDWTYLEGVYYAYITLTTIGFGDFVTGKNISGAWSYIYQIGVILWILAGLGYWVMVASFIQKALKSKKIHDLAKRAASLKKRMIDASSKDPQFVSHTSKATLNFLLQLSNTLVAPELAMPKEGVTTPTTPQIPGIAALFQQAGTRSNFKQLFSAGVIDVNLKTDANGNDTDRNSETGESDKENLCEKSSEAQSDLVKVQIESIPEDPMAIASSSTRTPSQCLDEKLKDPSVSSSLSGEVSSDESQDQLDKPFVEWLMLYQDAEQRNSLIKTLSLDLEHLQEPHATGNRPLSVGCPIEAVR